MRRRVSAFALIALALSTSIVRAAAAPATAEALPTTGESKVKEQLQSLADVATLPIVTAKRVTDVVELTISNNDLQVRSALAPIDQAVARAPGLPGITRVRIPDDADSPKTLLNVDNVDYSASDAISVHTSVSRTYGKIMLTQARNRLDDETHMVQLIQTTTDQAEGEPRVVLYVQITAEPVVDLRLSADSVVELRRRFPAEVAKYVDPIFRTLRQDGLLARVDSKLAWQVFADAYKPSADLMQNVNKLVKQLGAEGFQEREAASQELEKLDQPAALAMMRMDRTGLTDEQRGRIDAFLAKFKTVPDPEAQRLRSDPDFLLDCLFSEDESLRRQALSELAKVVGKPIEFDVTAAPDARLAAITRLRSAFGATPATTKKVRGS
jgi:hypothetical protein